MLNALPPEPYELLVKSLHEVGVSFGQERRFSERAIGREKEGGAEAQEERNVQDADPHRALQAVWNNRWNDLKMNVEPVPGKNDGADREQDPFRPLGGLA